MKTLQNVVAVQDEQSVGFEEAIEILKNNEKQLLEKIKAQQV